MVTRDEYGKKYEKGYFRTVYFLRSRGAGRDLALEVAQAAWAKGWERLHQLRKPSMLLTWLNAIALNIFRTIVLREPTETGLPELSVGPRVNLQAIDVDRLLKGCTVQGREMLWERYVFGYEVSEMAALHGCPDGNIRKRLFRALTAAAEQFNRMENAAELRRSLSFKT